MTFYWTVFRIFACDFRLEFHLENRQISSIPVCFVSIVIALNFDRPSGGPVWCSHIDIAYSHQWIARDMLSSKCMSKDFRYLEVRCICFPSCFMEVVWSLLFIRRCVESRHSGVEKEVQVCSLLSQKFMVV